MRTKKHLRHLWAYCHFLFWSSAVAAACFLFGKRRLFEYRRHEERKTDATLASLDGLLQDVLTLDEFLNNPKLIDDYAAKLEVYFGKKRFSRPSFDTILTQLKSVVMKVPEMKEKIWRIDSKHEFSFSSIGESMGRDVDPFLWRLYWRNYQSGLKRQIASFAMDENTWKSALEEYSEKVKDFINIQLKLSSQRLTKSEQRFLSGNFFKNVCAENTVRNLSAHVLLRFFALPENRQLLHVGDGDLILYFFKDLRQNPRKVLAMVPDVQIVPGLLSVVRSMIPDPKVLLKDRDLFPIHYNFMSKGRKVEAGRMKEATFRTTRIRPFHSLWLGIPGNDCLAGNVDNTTPQRWLVGAMDGGVTSVIERDGQFQGFTRCTPLSRDDGRLYGSFEVWSPLMIRKILVPVSSAGRTNIKLVPIFDIWFPQFIAGLPAHLSCLLISESKMIDNFGIKQIIEQSPHYQNSNVEGPSSSFRSADFIVEKAAQEFSSTEVVGRYGNGTVYDAHIRDAGDLRRLPALSSSGEAT